MRGSAWPHGSECRPSRSCRKHGRPDPRPAAEMPRAFQHLRSGPRAAVRLSAADGDALHQPGSPLLEIAGGIFKHARAFAAKHDMNSEHRWRTGVISPRFLLRDAVTSLILERPQVEPGSLH